MKFRKLEIGSLASIVIAVVGVVKLSISLDFSWWLSGSVLLIILGCLMIFYLRKRRDLAFESLSVTVRFVRWNDSKTTSEECLVSRFFPEIGAKVESKVFDETCETYDWVCGSKPYDQLSLCHSSSGLMTILPIIPAFINFDTRVYCGQRSDFRGNGVIAKVPINGNDMLKYTIRRVNGFQKNDEHFTIPSTSEHRIRNMSLTLDFDTIRERVCFKKMPKGQLVKQTNEEFVEDVPLISSDGSRWTGDVKAEKGNALRIDWELCQAFPDTKIYVFGYGSLMYEKSARETLGVDTNFDRYACVLEGFSRDFSAITRNVNGFVDSSKRRPKFVSYMNIRECSLADALGVLIPVTHEQLINLDAREWMYTRLDVSDKVRMISHDLELPKDAVVFVYTCIHSIPSSESEGQVAFGRDYEDIISKAHYQIDEEIGGNRYVNDFIRIQNNYKEWPRLTFSNIRSKGGYEV